MNSKYVVEKSKDGYEILKINRENKSVYIGSKYNEKREIDRFISQIGDKTCKDVYIVFGLGMANHINELIKVKHRDAKIIVVECDEQWGKKFGGSITGIMKDKFFLVSSFMKFKEVVLKQINEYNVEHLKVSAYANYDKVYGSELNLYYKFILNYVAELKGNINTREYFAETLFKSTMENLKYLYRSEGINMYKDIHKNKPAIIVSAGPSLKKNIQLINNDLDAVVICGGRTLKSLINVGVEPDYTVIVDPMEKSYELVENNLEKNINLIYNVGIQNDILKKHMGQKILYTKDSNINEIFGWEVGDLTSGGSVAHTMTSAALLMGCNPIIFIGQDFAYTDDKEHSELANSPWNPDEEIIEKDNYLYIEDIYGNKVKTSKQLYMYKCQMEKIISQNQNVEFINSTEGGAVIIGAPAMNLNETFKKYKIQSGDKLNFNLETQINYKAKEKLIGKLEKTILSIEKVVSLYKESQSILNEYKNKVINLGMIKSEIIETKIHKIDHEIFELHKNIMFCNDILYCGQRQCDINEKYLVKAEDNIQQTVIKQLLYKIDLYKSFMGIFEENLPIIKNALDEIK